MRFGTPRYRKQKTFLGGPLSMGSTGRKTLSFLGFQIPIQGDDDE